ncbi:ABC transporter substrate-binding protein [Aequorivita sp. CIP111184]|uniref:ABC transporter substrate-binding protein n=1 Tax=Aequorivita sp. CIP111184 TaxID=2211356 RepID=UPI000DBC3885|nr:helical backbone metal receptor [Aequorivita sp. CIP111184]SRX54005.1 Vitamin B12-binding protein [Aequorivita sp. CIP111184]
MEFVDQLNRKVFLKKTPSRIVSLVPSQTELLVDFGLRKSIVGITKFCVHPPDLKEEKKIVGGTKKVNFDKIKALNPDIIICNKEENTEEMVLQLESIAPVWVSDVKTIAESLSMIGMLGGIFKKGEKASEIISKIEIQLSELHQVIKDIRTRKVLYLIWKDPYMAAGKNTFIDALLQLNNFKNIIDSKASRYPEIGNMEFKKADLIFLSTEPYPFKKKDVLKLNAEIKEEVKLVDGEFFSWYGSRLIKSLNYFKTLHKVE